jgi:hypothetical protein
VFALNSANQFGRYPAQSGQHQLKGRKVLGSFATRKHEHKTGKRLTEFHIWWVWIEMQIVYFHPAQHCKLHINLRLQMHDARLSLLLQLYWLLLLVLTCMLIPLPPNICNGSTADGRPTKKAIKRRGATEFQADLHILGDPKPEDDSYDISVTLA